MCVSYTVDPIGRVHCSRIEPLDDKWGDIESTIQLDDTQFAIDATPVLDIKPHVIEFQARTPVRQPEWITELMINYW